MIGKLEREFSTYKALMNEQVEEAKANAKQEKAWQEKLNNDKYKTYMIM